MNFESYIEDLGFPRASLENLKNNYSEILGNNTISKNSIKNYLKYTNADLSHYVLSSYLIDYSDNHVCIFKVKALKSNKYKLNITFVDEYIITHLYNSVIKNIVKSDSYKTNKDILNATFYVLFYYNLFNNHFDNKFIYDNIEKNIIDIIMILQDREEHEDKINTMRMLLRLVRSYQSNSNIKFNINLR